MPPRTDFQQLLRRLTESGVEFVVVGGVGAVLRGAPVTTLDLDIVHERSASNVERLLDCLRSLDGKYRTHPHVALTPDPFAGAGHMRLLTNLGPLDVLGEVGEGLDYDDLQRGSSPLDVGGFEVQVLELATLIRIKESVGRDKDLAVLAILRRTLEQAGE